MTLTSVLVLAVGIFGLRLAGMFVLGETARGGAVERLLRLVPVAVIAAVVTLQTVAKGQDLVVDARLWGAAVAALAVWRRAPLIVVLVAAAATTAIVRATGLAA